MKELWTREELRESVVAYKGMQKKIDKGESVVKTNVYKELAEKHGRTAKSFEFRMQNISYVLSASGREL